MLPNLMLTKTRNLQNYLLALDTPESLPTKGLLPNVTHNTTGPVVVFDTSHSHAWTDAGEYG